MVPPQLARASAMAAMLAVAAEPQTATTPPPRPDPALAQIAAAYAAKVVASAVFVSGRTLESVLAEELAPDRPLEALIKPLLRFDVERTTRTVTCRLGAATSIAVATGNLGCTLVHEDAPVGLLRQRAASGLADLPPDPATLDWPLGDRQPAHANGDRAGEGVDAVRRAIDKAFEEPTNGPRVRTRAVLVVHRGRLLGERYAAGYDHTMPLPGWSMTKTIVNALIGVRIQQGQLDPDAALPVAEWQRDPTDARARLRLHDLLTMSTGLRWTEDYDDPASDALRMLFRSSDHANVFAEQPVVAAPGSEFRYASGCSNLLCRILRHTFASDHEYWAFPRQSLFDPLGMRSAVLETDPSGTFVGSSYGFATARDWARFGMLYAQDGEFGGRRLLPAGWVERSARPTAASRGRFGCHIWCNGDPDGDGPATRQWPDLPANLLHLDGHEGQYCAVFPTEQIVVVRLGCTKAGGFDLHGLLRSVLAACPH